MINRYAFVFAALALVQGAAAQNWITITDESGTDVTNGTTSLWMWTGSTMEVDLTTTLDGLTGRVVNVKRYETSVVTGSQNYFCWNLCYLPQEAGTMPLWVASDTQYLNGSVPFIGFHGYHVPDGTEGYSSYRYVWYDVNNLSDSAFVDIVFGNSLGVTEVANVEHFSLAPNPANASVNVSYHLSGGAADALVVHNALGMPVLTTSIAATQRSSTLNTSALNAGVYFVSLQQRGRAVGTQRLVVSR